MLQPLEGQKILEIGCGPGVTAHLLIESYRTFVDAVDISKFQLERARSINSNYVFDTDLQLIKGDIAEATLPVGKYDGAFSEAVFFHLLKKKNCLENIRAALRPRARFVFDDLILMKTSKVHDVNKAFRRFGNLEFYTQAQYTKILQHASFRTVEVISASEDVAKTYLKLLGNLEVLQLYSNSPFPQSVYLSLRRSFRKIVALLKEGTMTSQLFVLTAI